MDATNNSDTMSCDPDVSDCDLPSSDESDESMNDLEGSEELVAGLALVVNSSLVQAAELELSVAKLRLELAEETLLLATARGKLAVLQHEDCEVTDPPAAKSSGKASSAGDDLTLTQQMKILSKKTNAMDKRYKVLNKQIDELQCKLELRREEVKDKEQELSDFIEAHQDCTMVEYPGVAKWSEEKMVLGGRVLYNFSKRLEFEQKLKAAPCLKSLTLHLKERFGRRRKKMASTLPTQLCLKAPARIKELTLEFGYSSKDAVLALIKRTCCHLEYLQIAGGYQHEVNYTDLDVAQFWVWLVDSNLKSLSLCTDKLLRKPFPLKAGVKFRRLEKLTYGKSSPREPTVLDSLIRACSDTLRCVELPIGVREDELVAVFEALGQCANLEEAVLDCVAEIPRLQRCTKLKRLTFMGMGGMLRPNPGAVAAVERFLRMPTTVQRTEALTLSYFIGNMALPIFRALPALKNLKSLELNYLSDFPDMKKVLKELSSLEELTLNQGDLVKPTRVAEISPTVVPKLKLLKLRSERGADAAWTRKVEGIRRAFLKVNPSFRLEDETGIEKESGSEDSDQGQSEDLESGSIDPGLQSASDDDEEDGSQCPVS